MSTYLAVRRLQWVEGTVERLVARRVGVVEGHLEALVVLPEDRRLLVLVTVHREAHFVDIAHEVLVFHRDLSLSDFHCDKPNQKSHTGHNHTGRAALQLRLSLRGWEPNGEGMTSKRLTCLAICNCHHQRDGHEGHYGRQAPFPGAVSAGDCPELAQLGALLGSVWGIS